MLARNLLLLIGPALLLVLAGCAASAPWLPPLLLAVYLALLSGCRTQDETYGVPCCDDGRVSSCACPAGWACNYEFTVCDDGTCRGGEDVSACGSDNGSPQDAGSDAQLDAGTMERCCVDGVVSTCFCPANVACNYGWFSDCGDGTCESGRGGRDAGGCGATDAGSSDAAMSVDRSLWLDAAREARP